MCWFPVVDWIQFMTILGKGDLLFIGTVIVIENVSSATQKGLWCSHWDVWVS